MFKPDNAGYGLLGRDPKGWGHLTASGAHVQWQGTAFKYSERNVTNFEPGHNLDRNSFLKVKKEVPQDRKEKHCRQCDGCQAKAMLVIRESVPKGS